MASEAGRLERPGGQQPLRRKRSREAPEGLEDDVRRSVQAMETTFITIHDLTRDANILYCSHSIVDVLDWQPQDVVGKPCWQFFHPDEVPFARSIHGRGVELDKASVLNYCRIRTKRGEWIGCECVFTIVYDVLIGCTSVYLDGPKAKKRAVEAPVVRQLFSSSPRDPRYHMLTYISSKFREGPRPHIHEPRAALFLNRFTRTLTINFATNGLERLLGIGADELQGNSFYYCIQPECLPEAIRCLESAKANDSIAYLRFWYRDPRLGNVQTHDEILSNPNESSSEYRNVSRGSAFGAATSHSHFGSPGSDMDKKEETKNNNYDDSDDEDDEDEGGVKLAPQIQLESKGSAGSDSPSSSDRISKPAKSSSGLSPTPEPGVDSRQSSTHAVDGGRDTSRDTVGQMFDRGSGYVSSTPRTAMSLDSPAPGSPDRGVDSDTPEYPSGASVRRPPYRTDGPRQDQRSPVELEAVISCTSDGLVVVIRAARPFVPTSVRVPPQNNPPTRPNGLFACPWGSESIMPDIPSTPNSAIPVAYVASSQSGSPAASMPAPPMSQPVSVPSTQASRQYASQTRDSSESPASGPSLPEFMKSIREVAVFAWALTGINGSLHQYSRRRPLEGAVPQAGIPIWNSPDAQTEEEMAYGSSVQFRSRPD